MSQTAIKLIIVFLPGEWKTYHRRPHWEAVSLQIPILAIAPPVDLLTLWRHPKRLVRAIASGRRTGPDTYNVSFFRPYTTLSWGLGYRLPWFAERDRRMVRAQLKRKLDTLQIDLSQCAFAVTDLYQAHLVGLFEEAVNIYEATDTYLLPPEDEDKPPDSPHVKRAAQAERRILSNTELVVASSRTLHDELRQQHDNVHYLRNCADFSFFSRQAPAEPTDLAQIERPRIGFAGMINDLLDYDLLASLAEEHPNWQFVMVGPDRTSGKVKTSEACRRFCTADNVHFLGRKPYEELPSYYHSFDLCLLPYRLNRWMHYSCPNKIFQYAAAGRPIVSTAFAEAKQFSDVLYVCDSKGKFIAAVEKVLKIPDKKRIEAGQELARENSTENRARRMVELIEQAGASRA